MGNEAYRSEVENWVAQHQEKLLKGSWSAVAKDYPYYVPTSDQSPQAFNKKFKFCRLALVTGSALYLRERQEPFNTGNFEGDISVRALPRNIFSDDIEISHEFSPNRYAKQDVNVIFPIERLRRMEDEDENFGELGDWNYSICDFLPRADRVETDLAPRLLKRLQDDEIDVAILVAVCELGHQTMALLQIALEAAGISTVIVGNNKKALERAKAIRAIAVETPDGSIFGEPNNEGMQQSILNDAFQWLQQGRGIKACDVVWHDSFNRG